MFFCFVFFLVFLVFFRGLELRKQAVEGLVPLEVILSLWHAWWYLFPVLTGWVFCLQSLFCSLFCQMVCISLTSDHWDFFHGSRDDHKWCISQWLFNYDMGIHISLIYLFPITFPGKLRIALHKGSCYTIWVSHWCVSGSSTYTGEYWHLNERTAKASMSCDAVESAVKKLLICVTWLVLDLSSAS